MTTRTRLIAALGLLVIVSFAFRDPGEPTAQSPRVAGASTIALPLLKDQQGIAFPPHRTNDSDPTLHAKVAFAIDVDSMHPLFAQNADQPVPIASVTKIMTAIVVLEHYKLTDQVTVSQSAAGINGSVIQLRRDEILSVESLLMGLLISSGNDAAHALAEHMGLARFMEEMNQTAHRLGMDNTEFKDPAGLDDSGRSTARDLGILAAYALRFPEISAIVRMSDVTITSTNGAISHRLVNSNRLVQPDSPFHLSYVTGFKTGFTPEAGHNLVASATKDGHSVVTVILNTTEHSAEASAKVTRQFMEWIFSSHNWND